MKNDVNYEVPIGTSKILISFEDGVSKWNGRLEGDPATHF
jgi:hypothetical protein